MMATTTEGPELGIMVQEGIFLAHYTNINGFGKTVLVPTLKDVLEFSVYFFQTRIYTYVVVVLISITHLIKVMIFSEMLRMLQNFFFVSAAAAEAAYLSNSLAHFPGYERYHDIIKWVWQR